MSSTQPRPRRRRGPPRPPAAPAATTTPSASALGMVPSNEEEEDEHEQQALEEQCLVCYTDLSYRTLTPCDHNQICGTCHLRLRYLHQDRKCPICKSDNEQVLVVARRRPENHRSLGGEGGDLVEEVEEDNQEDDRPKLFADYPIWGNQLGSDFTYRDDVGMFFPVDYYHREIQPLFGYACTFPGCTYQGNSDAPAASASLPNEDPTDADQRPGAAPGGNRRRGAPPSQPAGHVTPIRGLQDHLRVKHRLALCQLCVDHKRDFVARLPRLTPSQLQEHLTRGDGPRSGFDGHPVCEFCHPTRFYDITHLHQHLQKDHYKCHLCEQAGLINQFFSTYPSLEKHFDQVHFLCQDVQCRAARFIVFRNELDLRHHERQVHGGTLAGSTKIQLEFRVRRSGADPTTSSQNVPHERDFNYSLDGQAFVPASLPSTQPLVVAGGAAALSSTTPLADDTLPALHPLHVQRTAELRQRAAELRPAPSPEEAFPTLAAANPTEVDPPLRVGWASGATLQRVARSRPGVVTREEFPALPAADRASSLRQQQLMMMRPADLSRHPANLASSLPIMPVAPAAARPLSADQFPALATRGPTSSSMPPALPRGSSLGTVATPRSNNNNSNYQVAPARPALTAEQFPTLPTSQRYQAAEEFRQRMLGISREPSATAMANVLQAPPTAAASFPPQAPTTSSLHRTMPGKTKNAWGGAGGASTVLRVKSPPGSVSVAVAAAEAGPQMGTATKFMAKQAKQQQQQEAWNSSSNKKKGKQKDELRKLAFG